MGCAADSPDTRPGSDRRAGLVRARRRHDSVRSVAACRYLAGRAATGRHASADGVRYSARAWSSPSLGSARCAPARRSAARRRGFQEPSGASAASRPLGRPANPGSKRRVGSERNRMGDRSRHGQGRFDRAVAVGQRGDAVSGHDADSRGADRLRGRFRQLGGSLRCGDEPARVPRSVDGPRHGRSARRGRQPRGVRRGRLVVGSQARSAGRSRNIGEPPRSPGKSRVEARRRRGRRRSDRSTTNRRSAATRKPRSANGRTVTRRGKPGSRSAAHGLRAIDFRNSPIPSRSSNPPRPPS